LSKGERGLRGEVKKLITMKNISWGTKIAILYSSFVILIVFMVIVSMQQKVELVSDDYYANELVFQNKINEINNANALPEKITYNTFNNHFTLIFPTFFKDKQITGNIQFYRPSDKLKDVNLPIHLNADLEQSVDLKKLSKGMYKMKVEWNCNKIGYFTEETIVIP